MARTSKLFTDNYTEVLSLEESIDRMALESSILLNIADTFKSILPKLSEKLHAVFDNTRGTHSEISVGVSPLFKEFVKLDKDMSKELSSLNYVELGNILVSVPEGFKGNLLEYNKLLLTISDTIYATSLQIIQEYHGILSSFITNKENQTSVKDYKDFFNRISRTREPLESSLNSFSSNGTRSRIYFKDVIGRISDLKDLSDVTNKLFSQHVLVNLGSIKEAVFKLTSMLDIIIDQMAKQDISKVSKAAASNIAEGGYMVGQQVEFLSLFYYRCSVSLQSTVNLYRQLKEHSS